MTATPYPLPRETRESAILVGNGTVGPYGPSLYKIFDTADVKVFAKVLGATVYSDVTANCTIAKVNPASAYDFFTVTFNALVLASTSWYHQARRVAERSVAVTKAGTLTAAELEKELSKQATVESEVRRDIDRSAHFQRDFAGETGLPAAEADKLIGWNAAGDRLENKTPAAIGLVVINDDATMAGDSHAEVPTQHAARTFAISVAATAQAAAQAYADANKLAKNQNLGDVADKVAAQGNLNYQRTPGNATFAIIAAMTKMSQRADLRDWNGLDLTGVNDMTTLVQAAVTATAAAGQKLHVPPGKITTTAAITVPVGANIEGPGQPADRTGTVSSNNAFFHLAHLGAGFVLDGSNDGPRRLAGFGTYRDQTAPGGGWAPIGALADVLITGCYDAIVEDLFFYNPTTALRVTGKLTGGGLGNGRLTLRRLRGQPLQAGLTMTHIYDCIYVDDIHWWPYWSQDTNVISYTKANAFAVILGRVDWPLFGRVFSWGLGTGLHIQNQASVGFDGGLPAGTTQHLHADSLNFDNVERAIVVASGSNLASYNIDSLIATNTVYAASAMVTISGDNSSGQIGNIYGANTDGNLVTLTGTGNKLRIGASRSSGIDHDASGTPEFNVATGNRIDIGMKPITSAGTVYAFAGTGRISSPDWINFTPAITASSGAITTVAAIVAGDCKYKLEGTTCTFDYTFTITTNGTGAGTLLATLPFNSKKSTAGPVGRAGVNTISGVCQSGVARVDMNKVDGTYPGADATTVRISGSFEIA